MGIMSSRDLASFNWLCHMNVMPRTSSNPLVANRRMVLTLIWSACDGIAPLSAGRFDTLVALDVSPLAAYHPSMCVVSMLPISLFLYALCSTLSSTATYALHSSSQFRDSQSTFERLDSVNVHAQRIGVVSHLLHR
jgi:hypothetical protein